MFCQSRLLFKEWIFGLIIFLIFTLPVNSFSANLEVKYRQFIISYSPEDEKYVNRLLTVLDKQIDYFDQFYEKELEGVYTIEIPASKSEFFRATGSKIPEWSNALYVPSQRRMILKKPEWYSSDNSFEQVISHELSHLYFHQKFGGENIPLWFNEGLAEYLSKEMIGISEGVTLSNAIFTKKIIPIMYVDSLFLFNSGRARLAYLESLTAIQFIESIMNERGVGWLEFLYHIERDGFENALKIYTTYDLVDFEIYWYRWLSDKYKWFIVLNWENLIWIFITIVLLGALYAVRFRNKKILQNWEKDEVSLQDSEYQIEIDTKVDNSSQ
jgi:hypothetical protein